MAYQKKHSRRVGGRRDVSLLLFAWAGIVGPIVYVLLFTFAGFLRPDYAPVREEISNLGAVGAYRWIQNLNFFVTGLLLFAFAIGFLRRMRLVRHESWVTVSAFLLGLSGVALAFVAFFPTDIPGFPPVTLHGLMHDILFFVVFVPLLIAFFICGWHLRSIPGWSRFGMYSLATGLVTMGLFILLVVLSKAGVNGLMQRIFEIETFAWYVVISWRFLAKGQGVSSQPSSDITFHASKRRHW